MADLLTAAFNTPIASLFFIAGLLFLGIAVIGSFSGKIELGKGGRVVSGVVGVLLIGVGFAVYLQILAPPPEATETPTAESPVIEQSTTEAFSASPPTVKNEAPTEAPELPRLYNFSSCPKPCTGMNATRDFQGGTKKVFVQWNYENIPAGANYVRAWSMDGQEWIRYECTWPGPSTGIDTIALSEPEGLHSGTWELTITINGDILLAEQIFLSGNWTYWDPAGVRNKCHDD